MPWFKKDKYICDKCGATKEEKSYGYINTFDRPHWIVIDTKGLVGTVKVIIKDEKLCGTWRKVIE